MSYAVMTLCIILFINIGFFLLGDVDMNSPMISILKTISTGSDFDFGIFFDTGRLVMLFTITAAFFAVSFISNPISAITGRSIGVHAATAIGMAIFITFAAVPNFSALGIPEPLGTIINVFFGFLILISIMGFMKGG